MGWVGQENQNEEIKTLKSTCIIDFRIITTRFKLPQQ